MAKFKDLLDDVQGEIAGEAIDKAKEILRESTLRVMDAERTLQALKKQHNELLDKDVSEVLDYDFTW